MRVCKKGFDKFYKHSEDKYHRGGKSTKKGDRIWQRIMRRKLNRETEKIVREQEKSIKRTDLKKLIILISLWLGAQNEKPNDQNKIAACKATVDKCLEEISPSKDERSKIEVAVVFCLCMSANEEGFEARIRALGYEIEEETGNEQN